MNTIIFESYQKISATSRYTSGNEYSYERELTTTTEYDLNTRMEHTMRYNFFLAFLKNPILFLTYILGLIRGLLLIAVYTGLLIGIIYLFNHSITWHTIWLIMIYSQILTPIYAILFIATPCMKEAMEKYTKKIRGEGKWITIINWHETFRISKHVICTPDWLPWHL